jgi:hypothetical protein
MSGSAGSICGFFLIQAPGLPRLVDPTNAHHQRVIIFVIELDRTGSGPRRA